jgi:hypothetical protein
MDSMSVFQQKLVLDRTCRRPITALSRVLAQNRPLIGNLSVVVAVMKVRHMRVAMNHTLVPVPMGMRFPGRISLQVFVLVMPIVTVRMLVF